MARLPQPGLDAGVWGTILNGFLLEEHNPDGTLKIRNDGTLTPQDASSTTKGVVQLAGDLAGNAGAPTVPGLAAKEPTISSGTTNQYWRGDKSWQTLNKATVGLANVDNTADANKPISAAQQAALDVKVSKSGDVLTGDLTFPANVSLIFDTVQQYLRWDTGEGLWLAVAADNKNLKLSYGGGNGRLVIDQYGFGEVARFSNGTLSMRTHSIKDVAAPTDAEDAANKNYVDSGGWSPVPTGTTSAGTAGQKAYDSDYLYICIAANTWRRVSLATW